MLTADVRQKREEIVREHMESENRLEFDATMATFDHPRYELIATGDVHDGAAEVMDYFHESRSAFPDQRNELLHLHHTDDGVFVEFMLRGTHLGNYRGLPATGRKFECQMAAIFVFGDDRIICERVYFDSATILRQLGIAHDPTTLTGRVATIVNHPLTIGKALTRSVLSRS